MKLLIVTQKIDSNDENLGAFYYWFEEFGRLCEKVTIIGDACGTVPSSSSLECHSLGKERGVSRLRRLWKFWELFSYHYARCDAVFFHMIPRYVLIAAPFLVSLKRASALWYAHKSVTAELRLAERLVDYVFTSSKEGFRIPSKKVIWTGQAINTDLFRPTAMSEAHEELRLISVGRIAPVKNYEVLLKACILLKAQWPRKWTLALVGGPLLSRDGEYQRSLEHFIAAQGLDSCISFTGPRHYLEIPALLNASDLFINVSSTGSLDKAVLEAMACGRSVIVANEAYRAVVPPQYFLETPTPEALAGRIRECADEPRPNFALRKIVERDHSLTKTMREIVRALSSLV